MWADFKLFLGPGFGRALAAARSVLQPWRARALNNAGATSFLPLAPLLSSERKAGLGSHHKPLLIFPHNFPVHIRIRRSAERKSKDTPYSTGTRTIPLAGHTGTRTIPLVGHIVTVLDALPVVGLPVAGLPVVPMVLLPIAPMVLLAPVVP